MRYKSKKIYFRLSTAVAAILVVLVVAGSVMLYLLVSRANVQGKSPHRYAPSPTVLTTTPSPASTPQPLFYDDFTSNTKGWYQSHSAGYTRLIVNDSLLLSDTNHDVLIESLPTDRTFGNYTLTVVFTVIKLDWNDSLGVYVRGDSNLDHDYRIDIYGNGNYSISKEYLDTQNQQQSMYLEEPQPESYLNPAGQQNVLTVTMNGPTMTMLLNGSTVTSIADADYTQGQIALFVQGSPSANQVSASFDSVTVTALPSQTSINNDTMHPHTTK